LTLDAPERSVCTIKRQATSTPLQALILLNDPTYLEASRHLASNLRWQTDAVEDILKMAFLKIVNRYPDPVELENLQAFFQETLEDYQANPEEAAAVLMIGDSPASDLKDREEGAALSFTISLIYNLDEARYR
jgi:hypothetical protein